MAFWSLIEHTISTNKRGRWHVTTPYQFTRFWKGGAAHINYFEPDVEGQVAALSSGALDTMKASQW